MVETKLTPEQQEQEVKRIVGEVNAAVLTKEINLDRAHKLGDRLIDHTQNLPPGEAGNKIAEIMRTCVDNVLALPEIGYLELKEKYKKVGSELKKKKTAPKPQKASPPPPPVPKTTPIAPGAESIEAPVLQTMPRRDLNKINIQGVRNLIEFLEKKLEKKRGEGTDESELQNIQADLDATRGYFDAKFYGPEVVRAPLATELEQVIEGALRPAAPEQPPNEEVHELTQKKEADEQPKPETPKLTPIAQKIIDDLGVNADQLTPEQLLSIIQRVEKRKSTIESDAASVQVTAVKGLGSDLDILRGIYKSKTGEKAPEAPVSEPAPSTPAPEPIPAPTPPETNKADIEALKSEMWEALLHSDIEATQKKLTEIAAIDPDYAPQVTERLQELQKAQGVLSTTKPEIAKEKGIQELTDDFNKAISDKELAVATAKYKEINALDSDYARNRLMNKLVQLKRELERPRPDLAAAAPATPPPTPPTAPPPPAPTPAPTSPPSTPQTAPPPAPTTSPKAHTPELQSFIDGTSGIERDFYVGIDNYVKDKDDERKLFFRLIKLLEADSTSNPKLAELQDRIENLSATPLEKIEQNPQNIDREIANLFDYILKPHQAEIDKVWNEHEATMAATHPPAAPTARPMTPPSATPSTAPGITPLPPLGAAPSGAPSVQPPTAPPPSGGAPPTGGTPPPTRTPRRTPPATSPAVPRESLELSQEVKNLLRDILTDKELINKSDPVCLAINALIEKENIDVNELGQFLRNPSFLKKGVDFGLIKKELGVPDATPEKDITVSHLQGLEQKINDELEKIDDFLKSIQGQRMTNTSDSDKRQTALDRKMELRLATREVKAAILLKSNNMQYDSPRDVLGLINIYLYEEGAGNIDELASNVQTQINKQKELTEKFRHTWLSKCAFILKPTLKSTMMAIGDDAEFKSLGENPGAKLAELAEFRLFGYGTERIDQWLASIGGTEKHINTTIPRLIAYLESAIREGKSSSLLTTKRAKKIVDYLRIVQRRHFRHKINAMAGKTPREKMMLYMEELRKASYHEVEIEKKLLKSNIRKSFGLKAGTVASAGAIAIGAFASLPVLAAGAGALGLTGYITGKWGKRAVKTEKGREALVKGSKRAMLATALGVGAGVLWLPAGITLAAAGAFYPELIKHRKGIGKGAAVVGGGIGTGLWRGVRTIPSIGLWTIKYTAGLPYYGPKWLAEKGSGAVDRLRRK